MSTVAFKTRTKAELKDHIEEIAPGFLASPKTDIDLLIDTIALTYELIDKALETLDDRTRIGDADGAWLDQHGHERSIQRAVGESDTDYQARLMVFPDALTKPAILAAVNAILQVGVATMDEHIPDGAFCDIQTIQGFVDTSVTYETSRCFTVFIDEQLAKLNGTSWSLDPAATPFVGNPPAFPRSSFTMDPAVSQVAGAFTHGDDPVPSQIYSDIWETIERLRAGGVTFRVVVN